MSVPASFIGLTKIGVSQRVSTPIRIVCLIILKT